MSLRSKLLKYPKTLKFKKWFRFFNVSPDIIHPTLFMRCLSFLFYILLNFLLFLFFFFCISSSNFCQISLHANLNLGVQNGMSKTDLYLLLTCLKEVVIYFDLKESMEWLLVYVLNVLLPKRERCSTCDMLLKISLTIKIKSLYMLFLCRDKFLRRSKLINCLKLIRLRKLIHLLGLHVDPNCKWIDVFTVVSVCLLLIVPSMIFWLVLI